MQYISIAAWAFGGFASKSPGSRQRWASKVRWVVLVVGGLLLTAGSPAGAAPGTNAATGGKIPYGRNLDAIKRIVETLRGEKFRHNVPAFKVSAQEMRAIAERDLKKE